MLIGEVMEDLEVRENIILIMINNRWAMIINNRWAG
jgi:hypothetical protein